MKRHDTQRLILNPIGWLRDHLLVYGLEVFCGRFYGSYSGVVIDNKDPDGICRVRAIVPAINMTEEDDVPDNYWISPDLPGLGTVSDTGEMTGMFWPPDEKTNIRVSFRHGDTRYPIYSGGFLTMKNAAETFLSTDAFKRGFRTKVGHFLRFDDDPDNLSITLVRGDGEGAASPVFFSLDKDGSVQASNIKGSQIFLDAVNDETTVMNANGSDVTSLLKLGDDTVLLQTKSGGMFSIDGKEVAITGDNVVADCNKQFYANAGSVKIGANAAEPMIRGNKLMQWVLTHTHTHPMGPTLGSILPVILMNELSEKVSVA